MSRVVPRRVTADIDDDFVVFPIGIRINKPWKVRKWLPAFLARRRGREAGLHRERFHELDRP